MTGGYISPFGKPRGLASRLADMAGRMGTDRNLPWAGLGIIEDLKLAASILCKREWLEALRLSDDPDAQRFAAEALEDIDELETVETAAASVQGLLDEPHALPGVETIEKLDDKAVALSKIRAVLYEIGVADKATTDDEMADFIRALLS